MKLARLGSILVIFVFLSVSFLARAQEREVHEVYFDTLVDSMYQPTPIAVDEMKYIGDRYINATDSTIMRYITAVVQFDIDFYADFELVLIDSFYIKTYEIREMDAYAWKQMGAEYQVKLESEFLGRDQIRVWWRLFDTNRRNQFAKGTIEGKTTDWRTIGHKVSNEIVKTLTGERGIFLTHIAYVKKIGKGKEIFIAEYDGTSPRQLTNNGSINLSPAFSPDGKYIYYTSFVDGDPHLYRVDVKTTKTKQIASYPGLAAAPSISPDGNKIACVLSKDGNSEIYLLDTNGKVIKRITNHRAIDTSPTWSPDGRLLAFQSDRSGAPQIYMVDAFGMNLKRLTFEGRYNDSPIWSQRGDRITFVSRTRSGRFDLASIDTSGTDFRVLTEVGMNENPHFSPDGKHIVFSSTRLGTRSIFTMDITGRNQRRLTRKGACSNPVWEPFR